MIARFSATYLRVMYVFLALWPLVHMQLSFVMEFSPWKFMGWGMYATPYPDSRKVVAFTQPFNCRSPQLTTQGVLRPMILQRGPALPGSFFELYRWELAGVSQVPIVMPPMEFVKFFVDVKRFHVLNSEASLEVALDRAAPFRPVLVAAFGPRLDLKRKILYSEMSLYRYANGQARLISHFRSGDVEPIMRIGRELDCI